MEKMLLSYEYWPLTGAILTVFAPRIGGELTCHQYFTLVRMRALPGTDSPAYMLVAAVKIFGNILIMLYFCGVVFKNIVMFKIFEHC